MPSKRKKATKEESKEAAKQKGNPKNESTG